MQHKTNVTLREAIPTEELVSGSYLKICHWQFRYTG